MHNLTLVTKTTVCENLHLFLFSHLNKQAVSLKHLNPIEPWGIELKDNNSLQGGASGFTLYGALYTDMLYVGKDLRGLGYGTKMIPP